MDVATTATLNEVFQNHLNVIVDNAAAVQGSSSRLLLGLATIEFLLFLYGAYLSRGEDVIRRATEKLFLIFVVALLTFNWGSVAGFFKGYIVGAGASAGGASQMARSLNPAYIASDGFDKVGVIFNAEAQQRMMQDFYGGDDPQQERRKAGAARRERASQERGFLDRMEAKVDGMSPDAMLESLTDAGQQIVLQIVAALLFCTLAILIILVHFYVALQVFVLTIDWYLTVSLTNLLIPFAVNRHTSGLASAALNAVVQKSFQLAVLIAILGMFGNTIQGLGLGPSPTLVDILSLLLGSLTMAFMVRQAPQIAGSIFSGAGSSIDVGSTLAAAATSVGQAAASYASGGASAVATRLNDESTGAGKEGRTGGAGRQGEAGASASVQGSAGRPDTASAGQTSAGQASAGQASAGQTSAGQASASTSTGQPDVPGSAGQPDARRSELGQDAARSAAARAQTSAGAGAGAMSAGAGAASSSASTHLAGSVSADRGAHAAAASVSAGQESGSNMSASGAGQPDVSGGGSGSARTLYEGVPVRGARDEGQGRADAASSMEARQAAPTVVEGLAAVQSDRAGEPDREAGRADDGARDEEERG